MLPIRETYVESDIQSTSNIPKYTYMIEVIYNLCSKVKSRVNVKGKTSKYFDCNTYFRQMENSLLIVFAISLNDMLEFNCLNTDSLKLMVIHKNIWKL